MGTWRAIADLGFAIKRDLGEDADFWSDEELGLRLEECRPLMYAIKDQDGSATKTSLVPCSQPSGSDKSINILRRHTA